MKDFITAEHIIVALRLFGEGYRQTSAQHRRIARCGPGWQDRMTPHVRRSLDGPSLEEYYRRCIALPEECKTLTDEQMFAFKRVVGHVASVDHLVCRAIATAFDTNHSIPEPPADKPHDPVVAKVTLTDRQGQIVSADVTSIHVSSHDSGVSSIKLIAGTIRQVGGSLPSQKTEADTSTKPEVLLDIDWNRQTFKFGDCTCKMSHEQRAKLLQDTIMQSLHSAAPVFVQKTGFLRNKHGRKGCPRQVAIDSPFAVAARAAEHADLLRDDLRDFGHAYVMHTNTGDPQRLDPRTVAILPDFSE